VKIKTLLFLMLMGCILSTTRAEIAKDLAWETYISSQKKIKVAFHHLIRLHWPHLSKTVLKSQNLQLAQSDERSMQYYYLLEYHSDRIVKNQGFQAFTDFEWTDKDEEKLISLNSSYEKLRKQNKKTKDKLEANLQYREVMDGMASLEDEREYLQILARFRFVSEEVEEILRHQTSQVV